MSPDFTARPFTLGRLLSDPYTFQIPTFQRSFAWTTKEAGQLLDDLTLALEEQSVAGSEDEAGYFLGAILLTEPLPSAPPRGIAGVSPRHDIIDGQQRLATLTIMLAVLRDLIAQREGPAPAGLRARIACQAGSGEHAYRLELRIGEADFFRHHVQEPGTSLREPDSSDPSDAERRILDVRDHFACELGARTAGELSRLADFIDNGCHVAVITARSIDRAHRIFSVLNDRGRPLARNDILKAEILGQVQAGARARALAIWEDAEARLGDDFEVLFSHIRAIEVNPRTQIITGLREIIIRTGGAQAFAETVLEPCSRAFHAIRHAQHSGSAYSDQICRSLGYLGWLGSADWVPPALLWWRRHEHDAESLSDFLVRLERLAYSVRLLGIGADKRLARFQAVVQAIRAGTVLDARSSPMELSRDEQRNILYNLRSLHARSQLACKLVLLRLNDELAGAAQNLSPADFTVEHVLPQKPSRTSAWRSWFPSADEREACTNSIGNLVLVTRQQNDRARNGELARKHEIYFQTDGVRVPHITAELEGISEWRAPQILAREERLVALIRSIWRLEAPRAGELAAPRDTRMAEPQRRSAARSAAR